MQIGFFFGVKVNVEFVDKLSLSQTENTICYATADGMAIGSIPFRFVKDANELIAASDVLAVFSDKPDSLEKVIAAIRKGVHVFCGDLSKLSLSNLLAFRNLQQEIEVSVGFGHSGIDLVKHLAISRPIDGPVFIDSKRSVRYSFTVQELNSLLTFDMATLFRLSKSSVRKVRVAAFPIDENRLSLLNVRVELNDSSILCYTLTNDIEPESFNISLFINESLQVYRFSNDEPFISVAQSSTAKGLLQFVEGLNIYTPIFSVERAIDLHRLLQEIFDKLSMNVNNC